MSGETATSVPTPRQASLLGWLARAPVGVALPLDCAPGYQGHEFEVEEAADLCVREGLLEPEGALPCYRLSLAGREAWVAHLARRSGADRKRPTRTQAATLTVLATVAEPLDLIGVRRRGGAVAVDLYAQLVRMERMGWAQRMGRGPRGSWWSVTRPGRAALARAGTRTAEILDGYRDPALRSGCQN